MTTRRILPDEARARCLEAAKHPVIRYVATFMAMDGLRTMMGAAQGRNTYATPEEAQAWIDAVRSNIHNSTDTLRGLWGDPAKWEVRPCDCWPVHFDPIGIYFKE